MKKRPIIMSTEEVRGFLENRRSMIRRVIKPQPEYLGRDKMWNWTGIIGNEYFLKDWINNQHIFPKCPYGQVGDRLWVKETWRPYSEKEVAIQYKANGAVINFPSQPEFMFYACGENWRSPRFMPRWASRIEREITGVRAERLQDISPKDCIAEGCPRALITLATVPMQDWYHHLWDPLNAKRGYAWNDNPWVWVISF